MTTLRKNHLMYKQFGMTAGKYCKDCEHLHKTDRGYYKCECYGATSSEASDWRFGMPACGLFNKPYHLSAVIGLVQPQKDDTQVDGQMDLMDFI